MRRLFPVLVLLISQAALASEPLYLFFEIHGRTPLHRQPSDSPGYGLQGAAVWEEEPLIVTVTALNVPADEKGNWTRRIEWTVTTEEGGVVEVAVEPDANSPIKTPHSVRLAFSDTLFANFRFSTLPAGRYIVALSWTDPRTGEKRNAERRLMAIYRGDEEPLVRSFYLREQAQAALKKNTFESFQRARTMLLEAAKDNSDPSVYEELADASAPWAAPDETAEYYQRSLDLARKALETNVGPQKDWPEKARSLYEPRERKVNAFRQLVPYYRNSLNQVRIFVEPDGRGGKFVVIRRSDGARLKVIDPNENVPLRPSIH